MKNKIINIVTVCTVVVFGFTGCYKDVVKPKEPYTNNNTPPDTVYFSAQLIPLFAASCISSGCHGGAYDPNLTSGSAYTSLISGGYINTGNPAGSLLYTEVESGSMPIGSTLTSAQKKLILDWIKIGAPNN